MLCRAWYLTGGDPLADHNATPPDLLSGVTPVVGGDSGSGRAHDMATFRLASCAGLVTGIHSAAAGNRAAQQQKAVEC
ncbi:hypothetical protein [Micromonospora sp. CB01531]|uniref:hypothetical protein n=1 Tax=Micromonospora sp. CB01531 TaxID=1718947 RepID=UPI00093CC63C|nr:hypothetical protein [Micromonospora sp. CB01531]OKI50981.1 hypothetical protein A6A27_33735 [Micromonospora sp. CB01531]